LIFESIRTQFPFLEEVTYFDSASVSPPPRTTLDAMLDYYLHNPYNYGVGNFEGAEKVRDEVDNVRSILRRYLHGNQDDEVVFTKNTTEAINILANGIRFNSGDEIILSDLEHQSNLIPWFRLQDRENVKVKIVKSGANGIIDPSELRKLISNKTRIIGVTHVSNLYGSVQPIEEIGEVAKESGIMYFVDAAQSLGRVNTEINKVNCDFMAICGRKGLLGPQGTGALYAKKGVLDKLEPTIVGSRGANIDPSYSIKYLPPPQRFESGVLNTAGIIGLGTSVEFLRKLGQSKIETAIHELTAKMLDGLHSIKGVTIYKEPPLEESAGIVSWNLSGLRSFKLSKRLYSDHKIAVASGAQGSSVGLKDLGIEDVVRTSVHFFNSEEDIDLLIKSVKSLA